MDRFDNTRGSISKEIYRRRHKLKDKLKKLWSKLKTWTLALLVSIGILVLPTVVAGPIGFSWENPTRNIDGSVYNPVTDQLEIRIYCNGDTSPTFVSQGDGTSFSADVPPGTYTCYATAVNIDNVESGPSNTVTKVVEMPAPEPPVLN